MSPKDIKKVSRLHGITKSFCQLVLVAQGFKLSSWIASRMGLQALGSSLDERIEDNSSCYKPMSPIEGQEPPWHGLTWIKPVTSPSAMISHGAHQVIKPQLWNDLKLIDTSPSFRLYSRIKDLSQKDGLNWEKFFSSYFLEFFFQNFASDFNFNDKRVILFSSYSSGNPNPPDDI